MYILLTAATKMEIEPVMDFLQQQDHRYDDHEFGVLVTGIGSIHTSYALAAELHNRRPDYLIQAGIAGSFSTDYTPGSMVFIKEELNGDLGVEENGLFKDVFDMNLQQPVTPYTGKALINPRCDDWKQYGLPFVTAITINEITTNAARIQQLQQKYDPVVESMEGAAFHYIALKENIPFIQVRAISNYVGERDKTQWKMKEAVEILNEWLIKMVKTFAV
jgi:futalosine hydrolase